VEGNRPIYRYDKIHLVPFGEYMPLTWLLPLGPGIAARQEDYSAGELMTVMHLNGFPPFSVLICYEAIFPGLAREAVNNGAKLLINITNDGWFGRSAAPYQHVELARMRSVENRVWMLRAANTGVSAAFDPAGRAVAHIPLEKEGYAIVSVPSSPVAGSFYSRFGDLFAWACVGTSVLMIVASLKACRYERVRRMS
jgi:apolipoprotein N-acyltransferase